MLQTRNRTPLNINMGDAFRECAVIVHPGRIFPVGAVIFQSVGRVAQLVEQCPFKAWVAGSSPAALTM